MNSLFFLSPFIQPYLKSKKQELLPKSLLNQLSKLNSITRCLPAAFVTGAAFLHLIIILFCGEIDKAFSYVGKCMVRPFLLFQCSVQKVGSIIQPKRLGKCRQAAITGYFVMFNFLGSND